MALTRLIDQILRFPLQFHHLLVISHPMIYNLSHWPGHLTLSSWYCSIFGYAHVKTHHLTMTSDSESDQKWPWMIYGSCVIHLYPIGIYSQVHTCYWHDHISPGFIFWSDFWIWCHLKMDVVCNMCYIQNGTVPGGEGQVTYGSKWDKLYIIGMRND